jgi:mannose-6-phosphate isomerase-like protein (cupin superfamily)
MSSAHVWIEELEAIVAPDGSTVREVARPPLTRNQSLAQAVVEPGGETVAHLHRRAEEIYLFVSGSGRVRLADELLQVEAGSAVVIAPGTPHKLWNTGAERLVLFCCCSPPYTDEDTVLLDS